ncbi:DUF1295 domain-containing protein [Blastopirellula sp. JC732]|uniref:DUF1295 domain-containing protein n=1 Tax=Blastopirellula sediminis TaxID=2894196 RepID=A0A9X1MLM8_9BACT|nr:DUF1295 domain-containing protein [Blastopirellula sediminis]MCC9608362.1 DUF1295 domain-containing protein [Blastopirellula sediminis]MCC9628861.1 DUF1295 domain-containing protein [Blastopirellula sediminis]
MSPELTDVLFRSASVIAGFMALVWAVSLWRKDASVVDVAWGLGFVLVAWTAYFGSSERNSFGLLLPILTTIWGVRLSGYLFWRNHGHGEDYRYREMRDYWGASFPWVSLLTVFGLQGLVMWTVSLPLQAGIACADRSVLWLTIVGVLLWGAGLFFEAVGDWQLARFRATRTSENAVLDTGLWRYTRHPNYFGDFLVWWGFYLVAVAQSGAWWTAIGPAAMSVFLMRVSGVTLLEKSLSIKKPGYADYVARTNAFFPGLPKGK